MDFFCGGRWVKSKAGCTRGEEAGVCIYSRWPLVLVKFVFSELLPDGRNAHLFSERFIMEVEDVLCSKSSFTFLGKNHSWIFAWLVSPLWHRVPSPDLDLFPSLCFLPLCRGTDLWHVWQAWARFLNGFPTEVHLPFGTQPENSGIGEPVL